MAHKFDVVVVGAALNGLAVALALAGPKARRALSVAVVDIIDPWARVAQTGDARASALTSSTQSMFAAMGVWDHIALQTQVMQDIIVTDSNGHPGERPVLLQFGDADQGQNAKARMVENHVLLQGLLHTVEQSNHITLFAGRAVTAQQFEPGLASLSLADGTQLTASLIVAADGAKSAIRQAANISLVGWTYDQMGLVVSFDHALPHYGRAAEHFTASGPFAVLPLTGKRSSIVWTKETPEAKKLVALAPADFEQELQAQLGMHLGKISVIGTPQAYPLSMLIAKAFHGPRLALVGDAAHVIHPLAGLGLNLGYRDAAALAECVSDAFALGEDIGGMAVLERYTEWRRFDTVATAAAMDGFNRLFSNSQPLLKIIRDFGLSATNRMTGLKSAFEREAAGQTGDLPRLLRGEAL